MIGKIFTLLRATLAIEEVDGRRDLVNIPADSVVQIISQASSGPDPRMITIKWGNRTVQIFEVDFGERCQEAQFLRARGTSA